MDALDTNLVDAYTGGVNLPNASQANQVAVANPQGNNLAYKPAATAFTIDGSVAAALAPMLLPLLACFTSINIQVFTSNGTYNRTAGCKRAIVISTGGGGASGGALCAGAGSCGASGAGASGGTAIDLFTDVQLGASQAVGIGVGGTAGTPGGNGGNGGNTTFGALRTAPGGNGGNGTGTSSSRSLIRNGGNGNDPSGSLLDIDGGEGGPGFAFITIDATDGNENSIGIGGTGGTSFWGGGGRGAGAELDGTSADSTALVASGRAGSAWGSGAGGSVALNDATGIAGAAGKGGVVMVIEFLSV